MTQKLFITCSLISGIVLSSCGTGKKLEAANAQVQQLQAANSELTAKQNDLQKQIDNLTASNKSVEQQFAQYKSGCEQSSQKLQAMQAAEKEDEAALNEMEKKIDAALANFNNKGVDVYQKDRVIYINMEDKLLYKSGSAVLGEDGKTALENIAAALNEYPDLKVVVVGHTDDKKFKNSNSDNLSLSTERANSVVRVLRDSYHVDPTRLTAAGKGKYSPVADNTTEEGRAKNRRTEIILRPDFMKLWESVQK